MVGCRPTGRMWRVWPAGSNEVDSTVGVGPGGHKDESLKVHSDTSRGSSSHKKVKKEPVNGGFGMVSPKCEDISMMNE